MRVRLLYDRQEIAATSVRDDELDTDGGRVPLTLTFSDLRVGVELSIYPSTRFDLELVPDYMDWEGYTDDPAQ